MITPEIQKTTDEAKKMIVDSNLSEEEKQRWTNLLDSARENCNGRTQKEKIQGIAEMLLEHTKILAEHRISDLNNAGSKEILNKMFAKVSEINQVQSNQQEMMRSMHENVDRLSHLSQLVHHSEERMTNLEQQRIKDMESIDARINNLVNNTVAGISKIRDEISEVRIGTQKTQELFIKRLDEYANKQDEYDKDQDRKTNERFASMDEKLEVIREGVQKDPETWKGVIARTFTPKSMAIVIVVALLLLALRPQVISLASDIAAFIIRLKTGS